MYPQSEGCCPEHLFNQAVLARNIQEEEVRYAALFVFERELRAKGFRLIAGVDEAGRGPLAGPVTAAAVILPEDVHLPGLNDSKLIPARKRAALAERICVLALAWAVGTASVTEIDSINIRQASFLAMRRALDGLPVKPDHIIVDGSAIPGFHLPQTGVIRGDAQIAAVAAASVLAKVVRDKMMEELDVMFPAYGFCRNKGYPTPEHLEALRKFGPTPFHRRSFAPVKYLLGSRRNR